MLPTIAFARNPAVPARLDVDRTARGLTRLVAHPRATDCVGPWCACGLEYEADDGTRIALLIPKATNV
jgi:hypothetical protein